MALNRQIKGMVMLVFTLAVSTPAALADITGKVVSVIDGDTIKVLDANQVTHKLRLTGINSYQWRKGQR